MLYRGHRILWPLFFFSTTTGAGIYYAHHWVCVAMTSAPELPPASPSHHESDLLAILANVPDAECGVPDKSWWDVLAPCEEGLSHTSALGDESPRGSLRVRYFA